GQRVHYTVGIPRPLRTVTLDLTKSKTSSTERNGRSDDRPFHISLRDWLPTLDNLRNFFTVVGSKRREERQKSELRLAQRLHANADGPGWKSLEAECALQPR